MGVNRTTRLILSPLISSIYPIPKIALVPMVVILFGIGETSKYVIVVISVFFLVVINTVAGVMNVDERFFDIARNNGARGWTLIRTVAIPAALPSILTGINLGLGFALTVIVGTELLLPQGGLGAMIWEGYLLYDIPTIFAVLIVVALLGWIFTVAVVELERQLVPWRATEARTTTQARRTSHAYAGLCASGGWPCVPSASRPASHRWCWAQCWPRMTATGTGGSLPSRWSARWRSTPAPT